jgi:hypothetical protein
VGFYSDWDVVMRLSSGVCSLLTIHFSYRQCLALTSCTRQNRHRPEPLSHSQGE